MRRILLLAAALDVVPAPRAALAQVATRSDEIGGPVVAAEADGIGRYVFVGVGIDSLHVEAPWKSLANAVNDLEGVREVLQER